MTTPTASGLYRAEQCPASCALPQVRSTSDAAERGTAVHRYLERAAQVGGEKALAEVPEEHQDYCASISLDGLPLAPEYRQEVALSFDLATGTAREVGAGIGRAYGREPGVVYGTADVLHSQRVEVWDYKVEGYESAVLPPDRNPQLAFLALALARLRGADEATVGLIHIKPDGSWWPETAQLGPFDLDAFADTLAGTVAKVSAAEAEVAAGRVPTVSRGPWCRYCPAFAACPAVTSLVQAVSYSPTQMAEEIRSLLTPERASQAYRRLREIKDALKVVEAALYSYAMEQPITLGDGMVYGAVESQRSEIDGATARRVLEEMHGRNVADAACEFSTSKAAIQRALASVVEARKVAGEKVSAAALQREALAAIEAAGGVAVRPSVKVCEHKA